MLQRYTTNLSAPVRHEMLDGREYLVVPMVMITEGVHAGSNGPLYYPQEELAKTPAVWNSKPLVVYHPEENGAGVSACSPTVLEKRGVGMILNTTWDEAARKLRAEAWFDQRKLRKVDNRVLQAIENNQMVEVSTGVYTDNQEMEGEYNGKKYIAIARNYRPDHLAILPDKKGACGIADGAGLLQLNQSQVDDMVAKAVAKALAKPTTNKWSAAARKAAQGARVRRGKAGKDITSKYSKGALPGISRRGDMAQKLKGGLKAAKKAGRTSHYRLHALAGALGRGGI